MVLDATTAPRAGTVCRPWPFALAESANDGRALGNAGGYVAQGRTVWKGTEQIT